MGKTYYRKQFWSWCNNCDVSMISGSNLIPNKPKIRPFFSFGPNVCLIELKLATETVFLHLFWILTLKFDRSTFWIKNRLFFSFLANFLEWSILWKCGCVETRKGLTFILWFQSYLYIFRKVTNFPAQKNLFWFQRSARKTTEVKIPVLIGPSILWKSPMKIESN